MQATTRIVTLAAAAVQFPAAANTGLVYSVYVEPLRSNTHAAWIGTSVVTNDASGAGVIKQIAQPPAATIPVDSFDLTYSFGANSIDPTQFWGHGTTGEKLLVTYHQV